MVWVVFLEDIIFDVFEVLSVVWPYAFKVEVAVWAAFVGLALPAGATAVLTSTGLSPFVAPGLDGFGSSSGCTNRPCNIGMDVFVGLVLVFGVDFEIESILTALVFELVFV